MTTVLDETGVRAAPPDGPARHHPALAVLPWLAPALPLVAGLLITGTPALDVARYAAYLALGVVLPGTLVHRALRGSRGNLPEDLGLGAATGMLVLLAGWALAAATGLQALLPGWPLLILVLFLAVPGLRRHWRIAEPRPLPLAWSWLVAGALVLLVLAGFPIWRANPLPPADAVYYQDLLYHLALVHEMTRSMPFEVPQLAGDALRYHYLSDADIAIGSMLTGISPVTVLLRLWLVPVAAVAVLVTAALARDLTGKWWAGALGGVAGVAGLPLLLGSATGAMGGTPVMILSPSQTYALPLTGLLLTLIVPVLRGQPLRGGWLLVFPLALACAGAKSSALPPIVAGLVLAAAVALRWHRDRLRPILALAGLIVAAVLAGLKLFAGGGAGTTAIQPLAVLYWFTPYRQTIGNRDVIDGDLSLPAGVANASAGGLAFLAGLLVWWAILQAPRLLGWAGIGVRSIRRDPAAWLLGGMVAAGVGAMFLLWHPSASQGYFFIGVVPFAAVLTVWLLADRARGWRPVVAGLLAGALWAFAAPQFTAPARRSVVNWSWTLLQPVLLTAAVALVVAAIGLLVWRRRTGRLAWRALPVALIAAVLGAGLAGNVERQARDNHAALTRHRDVSKSPLMITRDETAAALWLDRNAGRDDLVATNVHCMHLTWRSMCDARAFWVAGLSGQRMLVESWGYTDQAVAADGVNGKRYPQQPAPYPDRFALNQRVFAEGSAADVAELRDRYGVRWLFADSRAAGGVAPGLSRVATLRLTSGPVTVYELR
ncbi:hypothetical protein [Paractinoplanes rishiriensis]|uniref:Uncharacterized protein n=1 Tax=Paractinoplanes rishiriensis TaxID=1050105 RepID=A0A919MZI8_9ACTN|nr:hypothetical protein [Actinoplanes rishiriensis]GIE98375.1 hypothetical protein Ari01nite_58400 [Actinoplanes rishiriensis]